jgi:hypothetical protein
VTYGDKHLRKRTLTCTRENGLKFRLPVIVEHLISLVNDHVLQAAERQDFGTSDEIFEATRSSNQDVAASRKKAALLADRDSSVDDTRSEHGAVAQLSRFVEYLHSQLTSRDHHNHEWLSDHVVDSFLESSRVGPRSPKLLGLSHELAQDWDQVGRCLSRTLRQVRY